MYAWRLPSVPLDHCYSGHVTYVSIVSVDATSFLSAAVSVNDVHILIA